MRKYLLPLSTLLLFTLTSCGGLSESDSDVSLAPQTISCGNINPANAHKAKLSKGPGGPYSEIGGKASATCGTNSIPATISAWVTIDEKVGNSHRVAARQTPSVFVTFKAPYQSANFTQLQLKAFLKCRNGTFRTTLNFAGSKSIQVGNHHSGNWIAISRCGTPN